MNVIESLRLPPPAVGTGTSSNLGQADFLRLMTTQLQNQDPFKPMENGEFLGQMAQFSTASGINDLQEGFNRLAGALTTQQTLQAASLVGRSVLAPGSQAQLESGGSVEGLADLPASGRLVIDVLDASGQNVRQIDLGQQSAGPVNFVWYGTTAQGAAADPGTYTFNARLHQGNGSVAVETALRARIESVRLGDGEVSLNLAGRAPVSLDGVRQIF